MAHRPLRILNVVHRFLPELGGTETHVAEVTRRLAARPDFDLAVLTTDRSGIMRVAEVVDGVPVIRKRGWPRERDYYFSPGMLRGIVRGDWDVVHFQGVHTLVPLLGMATALRADIPYMLTFHSGGQSSASRAALRGPQFRAMGPLLRGAARLVAVSRFEQRRFAEATGLPADRFTVINNGGVLPAAPADLERVPGRIVTSGRLERYKGHHLAVEALAAVRAGVPGAELLVLGSGPMEEELRALARRHGVADAVTIRHIPPADRYGMAVALGGASLMVALSSYEANPVGVLEAVSTGLPVLGFDTAGMSDLVEDGLVDGIAPTDSPELLAKELIARLTAPVARRPAAVPSWDACADAVADLYVEVAGTRAARSAPAPAVSPRRAPAPSTPLRVLHVVAALGTGGAERQLAWLVGRSASRSHTVALYGGGLVADAMRAGGHSVEVLGMDGAARATALPRLAAAIRRRRPDVVHVHLLAGQLWGIPAARLAGVRTVVSSEHSIMEDTIENRPLDARLRLAYLGLEKMVTRTVAVSETTRDRLVRLGVPADRITVVDNGIDFDGLAHSPEGRARVRAELGIPAGATVVGAVGRLEAVKRPASLIEALAPTLASTGRHLLLVGDGPQRGELDRRAERLGVADRVHLTGPRGDVPDLLAAMDVLVSCSRDETFGMAVVEALGSGLPVVHAECPALSELADPVPQALALCPVDPSEAAEAVAVRTATDEALALAAAAGGRFPVPAGLVERYGIDRAAQRMDALYRDLIARP